MWSSCGSVYLKLKTVRTLVPLAIAWVWILVVVELTKRKQGRQVLSVSELSRLSGLGKPHSYLSADPLCVHSCPFSLLLRYDSQFTQMDVAISRRGAAPTPPECRASTPQEPYQTGIPISADPLALPSPTQSSYNVHLLGTSLEHKFSLAYVG